MHYTIKTTLADELLLASTELFDQQEKWSSFLELVSLQQDIMKIWYGRALTAIYDIPLPAAWGRYKQDQRIIWYLKEHNKDAITIHMEKDVFYLDANDSYYDIYRINNSLKLPRYEQVFDGMRNIETDYFRLPGERGKYRFGSVHDDKFDGDTLAWYAGNRTEDFLSQVQQKLLPFISPEGTELMDELNYMSKRPYFF